MTPEIGEPCAGRGCAHKEHCKLYEKHAERTHGYFDSDLGWTCTEWAPKPKSEPEDDDGLGLF